MLINSNVLWTIFNYSFWWHSTIYYFALMQFSFLRLCVHCACDWLTHWLLLLFRLLFLWSLYVHEPLVIVYVFWSINSKHIVLIKCTPHLLVHKILCNIHIYLHQHVIVTLTNSNIVMHLVKADTWWSNAKHTKNGRT